MTHPKHAAAPSGAVAPLARSMGVAGVLFLTLSATTPASSLFVVVPDVIAEAGSGALLAMLAAALIAVCVGQVYAELGSAFPLAGGEYCIVARTLGPAAGFVVLGLNLANSVLGAAVLALGVGPCLGQAFGGAAPLPTALVTVAGATALGALNLRTGALVTGAFLAVELATLAVVAALGVAHPARPLVGLVAHPAILRHGALHPMGIGALALAVSVAVFAYDGYGSALYFGEELKGAAGRIGGVVVLSLIAAVATEAGPLAALLTGAPDLPALLASKAPFADFVTALGGAALQRVVSVGVALAIVNAVIAMVLLVARQLYAAGRDASWPAPVNAALVRLTPGGRAPALATLAAGLMTAGLCLVDIRLLLIATGAGVAVIYAILCVAALAGRGSGATAHARFRMPLFPALPLATLVALVALLAADALDPFEGRPGLLAALGTAVVSGGYYALVLRRQGGWGLSTPADEPGGTQGSAAPGP